jgi:GntR family transcriptional regulator/MocR family aminotransferase
MVVPPTLRQAALAAKYLSDWHTGLPTQAALAAFLDGGLFARHVRRMRSIYQGRHEQIVASVTRLMSDQLELVGSSVGLHMSALAPGFSVDDIADVARRAANAGVELQTLASFATGDRQLAGLVLGYGGIDVERIDEGLRRLRLAFRARGPLPGATPCQIRRD